MTSIIQLKGNAVPDWNALRAVNRRAIGALAVGGCLVLAACGPGASPSPAQSPTDTPGPTATPGQPSPTETPDPTATPEPGQPTTLTYDFSEGEQGWQADFSDYTAQVEPGDPTAGIEELPPSAPDDAEGPAFLLAATNRPDDVFMFLKRQVGPDEGLEPETPYELEYRITFLSDAPTNCAGIGGAPGEAVTMKAGASTEEPEVVEQNGDFRLSVDKGNQSTGGPAATTIGDVANGIPCEEALEQEPQPFAPVTHEASHTEVVETNADGQLWLLVGTDSGFEGRTTIYYQVIEVTLTPAEGTS